MAGAGYLALNNFKRLGPTRLLSRTPPVIHPIFCQFLNEIVKTNHKYTRMTGQLIRNLFFILLVGYIEAFLYVCVCVCTLFTFLIDFKHIIEVARSF